MDVPSLLLKQSLHRRVRLERRGERNVVVKRFEQRGPLGRALDGARARREFDILKHLRACGVDVPVPLGLRRDGSAFEVELEWIEDARSLALLCRAGESLPLPLARALARLLAGLHGAGVDHPDLHAGNVLVARGGRVLGIDFDKARRVDELSGRQLERDLVSLCAGLRENTRAGWRAAAFAAWLAALPEALRLKGARLDPISIESAARLHRRRIVAARVRRWTRAGSAVMPLDSLGGFARAGADPEALRRALAGAPPLAGIVRIDATRRAALQLWRSMARLEEHGLPAPRCWLLRSGPRPAAWFQLEGARRPADSDARGRALGALLDRGLGLDPLAAEDFDGAGLLLPRRLLELPRSRWAALLADWLRAEHGGGQHEFLRGFGAAWRGPRAELRALLAESGHA